MFVYIAFRFSKTKNHLSNSNSHWFMWAHKQSNYSSIYFFILFQKTELKIQFHIYKDGSYFLLLLLIPFSGSASSRVFMRMLMTLMIVMMACGLVWLEDDDDEKLEYTKYHSVLYTPFLSKDFQWRTVKWERKEKPCNPITVLVKGREAFKSDSDTVDRDWLYRSQPQKVVHCTFILTGIQKEGE